MDRKYIGQLARTDAKVDSCCQFMRSCFFVGPGNWLPASFLTALSHFGFAAQLRDLGNVVQASQVHVALNTKLDLDTLSTDLLLHINSFKVHYAEEHEHWEWHSNAFAVNIARSLRNFRQRGGLSNEAFQACAGDTLCLSKGLQKTISKFLEEAPGSVRQRLHHKLRARLARFEFGIPLGRVVFRAELRLKHLKGKVKPAAHVVSLRISLMDGLQVGECVACI